MTQGELNLGVPAFSEDEKVLFFCVRPDEGACMRLDNLRRRTIRDYHLDGRIRGSELFHISLHSPERRKRKPLLCGLKKAAVRAGDAVSFRPFDVRLHSVGSFKKPQSRRNYPLVATVESKGLEELYETLGIAIWKVGFKFERGFNPHLTLHYCPQMLPFQPIEPIQIVIREFVFIHSEYGHARHNVIARWPLRG
jgi:RNA 2',3'-cyclic 3'-phosphodiesterase